MRHADAAVWRAAAAVLDLPQEVEGPGTATEGPDQECSLLGRQTLVPVQLRRGGLGLHVRPDTASVSLRSRPAVAQQIADCSGGRPRLALCRAPAARRCECEGAASMSNTPSSADGLQLRKTCRQSFLGAERRCLGRSGV